MPWRSTDLRQFAAVVCVLMGWGWPVQEVAAQADPASGDWIMNEQTAEDYRRKHSIADSRAMGALNPSAEQTQRIQKLMQYHLSRLTHSDKDNLPRIVDRLLSNTLRLASPKGREVAMREILNLVPALLKQPDSLVRYNAVSLVAQLNSKPSDYQGGVEIPAVPFNPAHQLLLQVVSDEKQFLEVRIIAARGLVRILRDGQGAPSSVEKSDIATALVNTLKASPPSTDDGVWWFRYTLIEGLGYVDRIDNSATQPIVIETLLGIIGDEHEVWINRAQAAQSISQLPYPSMVNVSLIAHEIAHMLADLSAACLNAPNSPNWRDPFVRVYLSFRPALRKQAEQQNWGLLYQVRRSGLGSHEDYVKSAWQAVFPIVGPFFEGTAKTPNPASVGALTEWIQKNPPPSRQVVPGGKTFPAPEPKAPPAEAAPQDQPAPAGNNGAGTE